MKNKAPSLIPPDAPPPPYVPKTPISEQQKRAMYEEACAYWYKQCDYYGHDGDRPTNIQKRLQAILGAVDFETATIALEKTKAAALMSLLAAWTRNEIPGPDEPDNWEKKGRRATSVAKMLDKKDDIEGARSQYDRAEECFKRAEELRKKKHA